MKEKASSLTFNLLQLEKTYLSVIVLQNVTATCMFGVFHLYPMFHAEIF